MIASLTQLLKPAADAGIKVPENVSYDALDNLNDFRESHTHFFVYCMMQLGAPMPSASAHWENAKVIAALSDEEIKMVTGPQLLEQGFAIGFA